MMMMMIIMISAVISNLRSNDKLSNLDRYVSLFWLKLRNLNSFYSWIQQIRYIIFQLITAVLTKNAMFWNLLPLNLLVSHKHFSEHVGSIFRNYSEMEAVSSSEVCVLVYQNTRRHIKIESNHQTGMNFQTFSRIRLLMMWITCVCVCACACVRPHARTTGARSVVQVIQKCDVE